MNYTKEGRKGVKTRLLIAMYFVMLIGGLWYPVLMKALCFLICLFVASYGVAYKMVSKRI